MPSECRVGSVYLYVCTWRCCCMNSLGLDPCGANWFLFSILTGVPCLLGESVAGTHYKHRKQAHTMHKQHNSLHNIIHAGTSLTGRLYVGPRWTPSRPAVSTFRPVCVGVLTLKLAPRSDQTHDASNKPGGRGHTLTCLYIFFISNLSPPMGANWFLEWTSTAGLVISGDWALTH